MPLIYVATLWHHLQTTGSDIIAVWWWTGARRKTVRYAEYIGSFLCHLCYRLVQ